MRRLTVREARNRGFTVLEVLVAVSLMTTTCIGVATLFVLSGRAVATARVATIANLLAREKIEQLRAVPLDDPAMAPAIVDTLAAEVDGYSDAPGAGYSRRWSVTPLPASPALGVVVQVNVVRDGGVVSARVVTIRARKAL